MRLHLFKSLKINFKFIKASLKVDGVLLKAEEVL